MQRFLLSIHFVLCATPCFAYNCWDSAAQRYGVSADLLVAIARVESSLNPHALNRSYVARTGSYDIGLMQINSANLRVLAQYGIHERDLFDPCTNIHIGAWLLAQNFKRHGMTWDSIGAYNAACTQLKGAACRNARSRYAWRVYRQLPSQRSRKRQVAVIASNDIPVIALANAPLILGARVTP
jgi:soluble lytic murein transglycosylase-like protein